MGASGCALVGLEGDASVGTIRTRRTLRPATSVATSV
jgi:hypothetical protein